MSRRRDGPRVLPAEDPDAIEVAIEVVRRDELVALPTETVYGIACALNAAAIERLLEAKRRPATKGITLLVDDLAQVRGLAELPAGAEVLARRFWPGPLTLVLRAHPGAALPEVLTGGQGTIGFRMPDHAAPRSIARALGPLPLTSANLSGEPELTTAAGVAMRLGDRLGLVLDGGRSPGGIPSTVVAILPDAAGMLLLRAGALPYAEIEAALAGTEA